MMSELLLLLLLLLLQWMHCSLPPLPEDLLRPVPPCKTSTPKANPFQHLLMMNPP
jgi:hypothetical protein